jgi:amino acid transporter
MDRPASATAVEPAVPRRSLSVLSAIGIVVGIVIGAGIFELPSLVAGVTGSTTTLIAVWVAGGVISLVGALCYAELASTYPDAGGDYHFITRAYGADVGFLYAWARMTVIQTGSIAFLAFLIGDYASAAFKLGSYSTPIYAMLTVILLTAMNVGGLKLGAAAQFVATAAVVIGLLCVVFAGFAASSQEFPTANPTPSSEPMIGLAMVFVLLTYGGWNEAAYRSAEIRTRRGIVWALVIGIAMVTVVYLLVNLAMLNALGIGGMATSQALATRLLQLRFGDGAGRFVSVLIVLAAATTANATIITGARSNYALGRDFPLLGVLGRWRAHGGGTPVIALLVQGAIALLLVVFGSLSRNGLKSMIDYITPVFWVFFLLTGVSLFVLRRRDRDIERPFRVPLFPITPMLFVAVCGYMLWSSVLYAGRYSWVGLAVLAAGAPLLMAARPRATSRGFAVQTPTAHQQAS